jgi:hypothetical protein
MEFRELTKEEYITLYNHLHVTILSGRTFHNLTVLLTYDNPFLFKVLYSENNFNSHTEHIYSNLRDAYEDFSNAYAIEV